MDDVKAPERIWARNDGSGHFCAPKWVFQYPNAVEYIRADLHDALAKERDEAEANLLHYRAKWLAQFKRANQAEAEVERLRGKEKDE